MHIRTVAVAPLATFLCLATIAERAGAVGNNQESLSGSAIEHVRALDPILRSAFDRGMSQSATFVALVARLQQSDVIVHLVQGPCPGLHVVGCVVSVSQAGGSRYVRINFVLLRQAETTALQQSAARLVAQLGHELQHAIEIADDRAIVDGRSLERAYTRNGSYENRVGYETDAALRAGDAVLTELTRDNPAAPRRRENVLCLEPDARLRLALWRH